MTGIQIRPVALDEMKFKSHALLNPCDIIICRLCGDLSQPGLVSNMTSDLAYFLH